MNQTQRISGLGDVIDRYTVLLIDAYGVIHDGRNVFARVNDALRRARAAGRKVVVVTNSPQRTAGMVFRLQSVGVDDGNYDHIACSGELTWRDLEARNGSSGTSLPRVHFILQGSGVRWLGDVRNAMVDTMAQADIIIAAGMPHATADEARASPMIAALAEAQSRNVPMLVADSDETYPEDGRVRLGPGWIARHYESIGGTVVEYGKPFDPIYDEALSLAGNVDPSDVLMIGDNLATDVRGASRRGFDSMMVLEGGVHGWLAPEELTETSDRLGVAPTYVAPSLRW
jgi:HAD superfamily hydrolase (TIGR01459 family)